MRLSTLPSPSSTASQLSQMKRYFLSLFRSWTTTRLTYQDGDRPMKDNIQKGLTIKPWNLNCKVNVRGGEYVCSPDSNSFYPCRQARKKWALRKTQNIFWPKNINSITITNCVNNKMLEHDWLLTALIYCLITQTAKLLIADWSMKRVFFLILLHEEGKKTRSRLVLRSPSNSSFNREVVFPQQWRLVSR